MSKTSAEYRAGIAKLLPQAVCEGYWAYHSEGTYMCGGCGRTGIIEHHVSSPPDIRKPGNEALAWLAWCAYCACPETSYHDIVDYLIRTDGPIAMARELYINIEVLGREVLGRTP